jgi:hypothetical protein
MSFLSGISYLPRSYKEQRKGKVDERNDVIIRPLESSRRERTELPTGFLARSASEVTNAIALINPY